MKNNKLIDALGNINDKYIAEAHKENKKLQFSFSKDLLIKLAIVASCFVLVLTILPNFFKGADSSSTNGYYYDSDMLANEEAPVVDAGGSESLIDPTINTNKKLILTANLEMEALDIDEVNIQLKNLIDKYNGYVQNSSLSTYDYNRYYNVTIRIPAESYSQFIEELKATGNTTYYSEKVDDITDTYTDLTARLNSYKAQKERILELYDKAETIDELIEIEDRLSYIQYQIEYFETQIKNYDLLVAYSTLNLKVTESKVYTPVNNNFFYRLKNAFINGFTNFINNIGNLIIELVYNMWTIIFFIVIIYLLYLIYKKFIKKNK